MARSVKLSVNLNKIALLRNQRDVGYPDPLAAARSLIEAGADGLTVHPRPDERHIRKSDVTALARLLAELPARGIEFNIEGYPSPDYLSLVREVRPTQATLVPDAPDQRTSDHGWDPERQAGFLAPIVADLKAAGIRVSLFVDPDEATVRAAAGVGADRVELYTGPYAMARGGASANAELERCRRAGAAAAAAGLGLNAGHDLTRENLPDMLQALPALAEVSIGHAFVAEALWLGLAQTTRAYLAVLKGEPLEEVEPDGFTRAPGL